MLSGWCYCCYAVAALCTSSHVHQSLGYRWDHKPVVLTFINASVYLGTHAYYCLCWLVSKWCLPLMHFMFYAGHASQTRNHMGNKSTVIGINLFDLNMYMARLHGGGGGTGALRTLSQA